MFEQENEKCCVYIYKYIGYGRVMVFNATVNNNSVISWWLALLLEKTKVHRKNHRPVASHWQTLSLNVVSSKTFKNIIADKNISIKGQIFIHNASLKV